MRPLFSLDILLTFDSSSHSLSSLRYICARLQHFILSLRRRTLRHSCTRHSFSSVVLLTTERSDQLSSCVLRREDCPHLVGRLAVSDVVQSHSLTSLREVTKCFTFHLVKCLLSSSDGLHRGSARNCLFFHRQPPSWRSRYRGPFRGQIETSSLARHPWS
jgi:hypothetical protein